MEFMLMDHISHTAYAYVQELVEAHTVTISRLLEIAPLGTLDPTPLLYDT
jgi:hypothetical protein